MPKSLSMRTSIVLTTGILFVCITIFTIFFVNMNMREQAFLEAQSKARLLLDNNLAIHTYFTKIMKPSLFETLKPLTNPDYFDPTWMSSTFAVMKMQQYFRQLNSELFFYKEASMDARSPQNEADEYEKSFLNDLQKDNSLIHKNDIRILDGKPYLVNMRRGEAMEASCLRCHSTPDQAPGDLVRIYGPDRSFNRSMNDIVQAISIKIPLAEAYRNADYFSLKLSSFIVAGLIASFSVLFIFLKSFLVSPLAAVKEKAVMIAKNPELVGEQIDSPKVKELRELVDAFNHMSLTLKKSYENLEEKVQARTKELMASQEELTHEISERKKAEKTLQTLLDAAPVGVGLVIDRKMLWTNAAFSQMTGYTDEELKGRSSRMLYPDEEEYQRVGLEKYADIAKTGQGQIYTRFMTKKGDMIDVLLKSAVINPSSLSSGVVFTAMDITERKKAEHEKREMEKQLFHAQKLESLGILSGGIAHDFNNLLTVILGNLELALYDIPNDSDLQSLVKNAVTAARRSAELSRQMLAYSGKGAFNVTDVNFNDVVRENAQMFRTAISKTIQLNLDLSPDTPDVHADPSHVQQVIMNLITNASEALIDRPGTVTLSTGVKYCDRQLLSRSVLPQKPVPQDMAFIEVTDDGCGMDASIIERIFDPFFTTKFTGRGLGMPVVLGIVRGHNGAITVESKPELGTAITVYFPLSDHHLHEKTGENDLTEMNIPEDLQFDANSVTILVADDEVSVKNLMVRYLSKIGFNAVTASNGKEALDIFAQNPDMFTLVILDLTMPVMDGMSTFKEMIKIKPDVKVIICSGYDEDEVAGRFHEDSNPGAFLKKPLDLASLVSGIHKLTQKPCKPIDQL